MSSTNSLKQNRVQNFKKGLDTTDSRRRRNDVAVSIRKFKREEGLTKRRNISSASEQDDSQSQYPKFNDGSENSSLNVSSIPSISKHLTVNDIPRLVQMLSRESQQEQFVGLQGLRRLLSMNHQPPVQEISNAGAIPLIVQFLQNIYDQKMQFEASWALTNIASTEYTHLVVENNATPFLVELLLSPCAEIREQCAWCLGNICGDNIKYRDYVLQLNALPAILANIANPASESLLNNATWALSNFCRGKPQPDLSVIQPAIGILAQLISSNDPKLVEDACWALSYISDGDDDRIRAVGSAGVIPPLVDYLHDSNLSLVTPALRVIGNLVSGTDDQTQIVLNAGVLDAIPNLLQQKKKSVKKETCWMLSNIAAGTNEQIRRLMQNHEILRLVIQLCNAGEWDIQKETAWVLSNLASSDHRNLQQLVELGAIRPMCRLLDVVDVKVVMTALDFIEAVLKADRQFQLNYVSLIEEAEGIEKLEQLQDHENRTVFKRVNKIIETYLSESFASDNENDENCANVKQDQTSSTFTFGVTKQLGTDPTKSLATPSGGFNFANSTFH